MAKVDIHKAGGIILENRRLLVERSKNREHFICPGGSIEDGESAKQALVRELKEEVQLEVLEDDLEDFGDFYAKAATDNTKTIQMTVFKVKSYRGQIKPDCEVEEIKWVDSQDKNIKLGSIIEHEIIPRLKELKLID